jgi:hypothetical protein
MNSVLEPSIRPMCASAVDGQLEMPISISKRVAV